MARKKAKTDLPDTQILLNKLEDAMAIQPMEEARAEEEATSDEGCPKMQDRRREAVQRRFLVGLDQYKLPDDNTNSSHDSKF